MIVDDKISIEAIEAGSKQQCLYISKKAQREETIEKLNDMIKWISNL